MLIAISVGIYVHEVMYESAYLFDVAFNRKRWFNKLVYNV